MAKRMVDTRFWTDPYITELESYEQHLFLYLLTNPQTNVAGIYEAQPRRIVFETHIEENRVKQALSKLTADDKIGYVKGWVIIKNFTKYQNTESPKIQEGICRVVDELPDFLRTRIMDDTDSLFIPYVYRIYTTRGTRTKLNYNLTELNSTKRDELVEKMSTHGDKFKKPRRL